jgi:hypothetical protein
MLKVDDKFLECEKDLFEKITLMNLSWTKDLSLNSLEK